MSISHYEHRKQKNEMTLIFSKHKYSKLSLFYENTKKWKSWKTHLIIKIQTNYYDFSSKWHKINYVKNKIKSIVQINIWHKIKLNTIESYENLNQFIEDFDNVYEKKNKKNKKIYCNNFFFSISSWKSKIVSKISRNFEKFLTRFTFTINSLKLTDNEKIIHLFRNFFEQFTKKNYHLNEIVKYSNYVKKVRQTTNQMKIRNEMK